MRPVGAFRTKKIHLVRKSVPVVSHTQQLPRPPVETAVPKGSLKERVLHGIKWQFVGHVFSQAWRFATNLVLTRLLMPEAFGVMALIYVITFALRMLSDVGLRDTVIHNSRGDAPEFLNTLWSIQIVRGVIIWLVICALAIPFAQFYGEPTLSWLLPLAGVASVIRGFASTSMLTASRHIVAKWNVVANLAGNIAGTIAMVILALLTRNVVALVLGSMVTSGAFVFASYQYGSHKHRFAWDREAAKAVSSFGRWIIPSSGLTILLQQGDKLILGKLFTTATLGLYSIGTNLATLPLMIFDQLSSSILHPLYAMTSELPLAEARKKIRKFRLGLLACLSPVLWGMVVLSHWLFETLYSEDYQDAATFCSIAAFGYAIRIATDMGPIFQAHGQANRHFSITVVRCIAFGLAAVVGYYVGTATGIGGPMGIVYGLAISPIISYPYQAMLYRDLGMWQPEVDALGLVPALVAIGIFSYQNGFFG